MCHRCSSTFGPRRTLNSLFPPCFSSFVPPPASGWTILGESGLNHSKMRVELCQIFIWGNLKSWRMATTCFGGSSGVVRCSGLPKGVPVLQHMGMPSPPLLLHPKSETQGWKQAGWYPCEHEAWGSFWASCFTFHYHVGHNTFLKKKLAFSPPFNEAIERKSKSRSMLGRWGMLILCQSSNAFGSTPLSALHEHQGLKVCYSWAHPSSTSQVIVAQQNLTF